MTDHRFGGSWTERKLKALRAYLIEYQKIFTRNPRARLLKTIYVDAFAGTGERDAGEAAVQPELFGYDEDMRRYHDGSVTIALSLRDGFHRYVFIDNKASHVAALRRLVSRDYPELEDRCLIENAEANRWLQDWCQREDWRRQRAVVFLDPYGMNVEWETLCAIARTKAIDLWVLFPLGIGASRVLPNQAAPEGTWADRLTKLFGTDEWRTRFYHPGRDTDLFGESTESWTKIAGVHDILAFFL